MSTHMSSVYLKPPQKFLAFVFLGYKAHLCHYFELKEELISHTNKNDSRTYFTKWSIYHPVF